MTIDEAIKLEEEIVENENELYRLCPTPECDGTKNCKAMVHGKNQGCKKIASEHRQIGEFLKELKQLREQTRWIPVSEKMPKTSGVYRVTRYYPRNVMKPNYLVDTCFFDGSDTWHDDNRINHDKAYVDNVIVDNVIAWQENPEPYEESGEKQKDDQKALIEELAKEDSQILALAYMFAKNLHMYGVDVTKVMSSATENATTLNDAYRQGYYDAKNNKAMDDIYNE